ncbi:MAG TPA: helix-hairpin-helix domain-containing protein [Bryobacteraceae bacterium]|nr:helix-hairpin-helix domain-containing protein [Bryobacteraceae bacterium]
MTKSLIRIFIGAALFAVSAWPQNMPDGPGKEATVKVCSQCHELARALSLHQDRAGWQATMEKMISLGATAPPEDFEAILNYLSKNFPAAEPPKLHINSARPIDIEAALTVRHSQALAFVAWRDKHGPITSLDELRTAPGIDFAKFESHKDRILFN